MTGTQGEQRPVTGSDLKERFAKCEPTPEEHRAWHEVLYGRGTPDDQTAVARLLGHVLALNATSKETIAALEIKLQIAQGYCADWDALRDETLEAITPIADLYRLMLNQPNGFTLMRAGVSNGDFERIAAMHQRLSREDRQEGA